MKHWPLRGDQWIQVAYVFREGKLYFAETDNKEQQYSERELDVAAFIATHAASRESPYVEILAFLASLGHRG